MLLGLRPESIRLEAEQPDTLTGAIREAVYLGSQIVYEVEIAQNIITVEIATPQEHIAFEPGEEVTRIFQEENLHLLPDEEEVQSGG